ncbi:MAG: ATP-grasp domain-containing protein [Promethearchaeota archaeon]
MNKILIITEKTELESYRVNRIEREASKVGFGIDKICSNGGIIATDKFYYNGKEIDFQKYFLFYSIGNCSYNQYLISLISKKSKALIWPGEDFILMSDKFHEGLFFDSINVPHPKTALINTLKNKELLRATVEEVGGFPCVIKKVTGSEGYYVGVVNLLEDIEKFVSGKGFSGINGKKNVLLQEFISESAGEDFRVYCVGNEILGGIRRIAQNEDFRANISLGGKAEKVELGNELKTISKKIMREGKFIFAGIDFIKSKHGYKVIEINTSADFQGFEKATGINVAGKIIDALIKKAKDKTKSKQSKSLTNL